MNIPNVSQIYLGCILIYIIDNRIGDYGMKFLSENLNHLPLLTELWLNSIYS